MFRKILIVAMFATAAGYCFAAQNLPQVVTSEVFYSQDKTAADTYVAEYDNVQYDAVQTAPAPVPAWPLAGSDADVEVACESGACAGKKNDNV